MQYLLYNRAGAESFLEPKKSRPCHNNAAKIIRPCQYVYEKSVGPVGGLTLRHFLIQVHVPNFEGVSGSEDKGGGDNSIQFINIVRVGDKSFKERRQKIGGWKGG